MVLRKLLRDFFLQVSKSAFLHRIEVATPILCKKPRINFRRTKVIEGFTKTIRVAIL